MSYVPELNFVVSITVAGVKIYDFNSGLLIKLIEIDFLTKASNPNFQLQELFQRKIHYYQPSNIIVAVYNSTLVCVNATSLELAFRQQYNNELQAFKSTIFEQELGYFISTNSVEDCILNLKTLERKCYKEVDTYQLASTLTIKTYTLELFIDQKTKSLIICQPASIRLFSLLEFKYIKSYYNTQFGAAQFFYNPYYNYVIYTTTYFFRLFDINTLLSSTLPNLPSPSKDYQTINYKLSTGESSTTQKLMVWDSYKQKLIVGSSLSVYIIGIQKNLIELYYADAYYQIISIQLIPNKNIIFTASLLTGHILDYEYLINDNKDTFPSQINPRYFSFNQNMVFLLNDVNSQINLYVNEKLKSTWVRNNLLTGYIRVIENDKKNNLIYCIFDNEIVILDISTEEIVQVDQFINDQNIINILFEDQQRIFLQSQSQQVLSLQKKMNKIQIYQIIKLSLGISQYIFINNSSQLLYIDYTNLQKINIVNFSNVENKLTGQQTDNPIIMSTNIMNFDMTNDNVVVILLETQIILFSLDQMQIIKSVTLPLSHLNSNIKVDKINQRVFVQNKQTGSLVYDYSLTQKTPQPQINTFSNHIQFDENFIYSIVGHSANIYFRKDLQPLLNFRHFDSSLTLKQITYLGLGYFFLVEFISKVSIYELSPFQNQPIERSFTLINQYTIIDRQLRKYGDGVNDKLYQLDLRGLTQEGMFTYYLLIDLNGEQESICSWSFQQQQQSYQEISLINQLTSYLSIQQQKLSRLIITMQSKMNLHLPLISDDNINDYLDIMIKGEKQQTQVYLFKTFDSFQRISNLKINDMQITAHPTTFEAYVKNNLNPEPLDINNSKYSHLQQVILQDIQLSEVVFKIEGIKQVIIKNLKLSHNNSNVPTLTQLSITSAELVYIEAIKIEKCDFNLQYPILQLKSITKVVVRSFNISECQVQGSSSTFNFQNIDNLQIDNFTITQVNMNQQICFSISDTKLILINLLSLTNISLKDKFRKLQYLSQQNEEQQDQIFVISQSEKVQIKDIQIDSIESDIFKDLIVFQVKYVKDKFEINHSEIMNIKINSNTKSILFSLMGVNISIFESIQLGNIEFLQFIKLTSYQLTKLIVFLSDSISISNSSVVNYQIMKQSLMDLVSLNTLLNNFSFKNINLLPDNNTNQFDIPAIQINAQIFKIINSQFEKINGFYKTTISIQNSIGLSIIDSIFNEICSSQLADENNDISQNQYAKNLIKENTGIIYISDSKNIILSGNKFTYNKNQIGSGGSIYISNSQFQQFESNIFENNKSLFGSGGAIYCFTGSFQTFNSNSFIENKALLGSGGAISLNGCEINQFVNNYFNNNEGFVGGAIRYQNLKPLAFMNKAVSILKKQNRFSKNKSICYGQDIGSYPQVLDMKNYFEDDQQNQRAQVFGVQSGSKANHPIYLRFIDEEMKEIAFVDLKIYPKLNNDLLEELSLYTLQAESDSIGLLGDIKQGYSLEEFAFIFDLTFSFKPLSTSTIKIKSSSSLFQFVPGQQLAVQKPYEIQINIQFRECQMGEILVKSESYSLCQLCQEGFYSIVDPYQTEEQICKRCPIGSTFCQGKNITLENGYWRLNEYSDVLVQCFNNLDICQSQNENSKFGCVEGYKGPLCEECDVNGEVWGKQYAKFSEFDCRSCKEFSVSSNVFIIMLIFLFIFVQVFANVYNKLVLTRKYILATYLVKIGMISPNIQRTQTVSTSLMKILLNYMQFLMIVSSLDIPLPIYFTYFNLSGGDTSKHTLNRLDCVLFLYDTDLPNYIVRIMQMNLQPLILFFFIELFCQFIIHNSRTQAQKETLYTNLIIIFCFYQPSIIKVLSQAFSCRRIGEKSYIVSDLTRECLGEEHMYYLLRALLPITLFWGVLCPLFLFLRMRKYKSKMHEISILYRYGYLYQEYNHEHYYWDLIRIMVRSFAIVTINVFDFRVAFKGLIIQGIIIFYLALSIRYKPYCINMFNNLDKDSCQQVILTLYLIIIGYLSENDIVSLITAIFVAVLNGRFVLMMLQKIFIKPIPYLQSQRNIFQNFLYFLRRKVPYFFKWIEVNQMSKIQTFKYWLKIRKQLNRIVESSYIQKSSTNRYYGISTFTTQRNF